MVRGMLPDDVRIERDDLSRPAVHALLEEHLADMRATSPPESVHALDLDRLRRADITFWTAWADGSLVLATTSGLPPELPAG